MGKVGIITDSIHGLPSDLIKKYDIRIAPMGVIVNNKAYRDTIDITASQFYPLFKETKLPSSTNAATPGDFMKIYSSLSGVTDNMVYIGVSKAVTATFNVAMQTKNIFLEDHPGVRIELIDSKNCMGALGFLVLEAARAAEAGQSLAEVISIVNNMIPRVKYLSVLDTLRYLIRIGRMPESAAAEDKLRFRPVIGRTDAANDGNMERFPPLDVDQTLEKFLDLAAGYIDPVGPVHAAIHYSECREEADRLQQMFVSKYNPVEFYMTEYSPAALSSTGLMTGLSFYC